MSVAALEATQAWTADLLLGTAQALRESPMCVAVGGVRDSRAYSSSSSGPKAIRVVDVTWSGVTPLAMSDAARATLIQRLIASIKASSSNEAVMDAASFILAHVTSDLTRPQTLVCVEIDKGTIRLWLPPFPLADVGSQIWPAAMLLSRLIVNGTVPVKNKKVLELGCGTALCGLTAAYLGGAQIVTCSDANQACLDSVAASVQQQQGVTNCHTLLLNWNDPTLPTSLITPVDVVLGAAVVYEPAHVQIFTRILDVLFLAHPNALAYLALHLEHPGVTLFISEAMKRWSNARVLLEADVIENDLKTSRVQVLEIKR